MSWLIWIKYSEISTVLICFVDTCPNLNTLKKPDKKCFNISKFCYQFSIILESGMTGSPLKFTALLKE